MSKDLVGVHNNTWSIPDGVRATAQQEAHRTRISTSALPPGDPFVLRVTDPCRRVDTTLRTVRFRTVICFYSPDQANTRRIARSKVRTTEDELNDTYHSRTQATGLPVRPAGVPRPEGGGGRQGKPGVDEPVGGSALDVRRASAGVGGGGAG